MSKHSFITKIKHENTVKKDPDKMRKKLEDPSYIESAVYRLASIITDQILNLGGMQYD